MRYYYVLARLLPGQCENEHEAKKDLPACSLVKYYYYVLAGHLERKAKKTKNHNSVLTILDIGGSILDTRRYSEKFRDLGFRSILDTIFSRLIATDCLSCHDVLI